MWEILSELHIYGVESPKYFFLIRLKLFPQTDILYTVCKISQLISVRGQIRIGYISNIHAPTRYRRFLKMCTTRTSRLRKLNVKEYPS
jgi:hypothetical protein